MDSTVSVSKGCFVYKKRNKIKSPALGEYPHELWYQSYKRCWASVKNALEKIEHKVYSHVLEGLVEFIQQSSDYVGSFPNELPAATLLTGVNLPDHGSLFTNLATRLIQDITPHVVTLWSRDCINIKITIEKMCFHLMSAEYEFSEDEAVSTDDEEPITSGYKVSRKKTLQRSMCNLPVLCNWYDSLPNCNVSPAKRNKSNTSKTKLKGKSIVIIIPDLESFSAKVLQDFVSILSGYREKLPLILVLGVATAVSAVHRSLPHHVSSRIRMKVFHSQPSCTYLNKILDEVLLSPELPFHLGGKTFELLTNVFLFYDFSVTGFIQGYKYCMTEHFFEKDWTILTAPSSGTSAAIKLLGKQDIESIRKLPSIRKHIESLGVREEIVAWLTDDAFVKKNIAILLKDLHGYVAAFYTSLRCLQIITTSFPKSPLGKHLRDMYTTAMLTNLNDSSSLQECFKLLGFLSRDEFQSKLDQIVSILQTSSEDRAPQLLPVAKEMKNLSIELKMLGGQNQIFTSPKRGLKSPTKSSPTKNSPRKGSSLRSPSKLNFDAMTRTQFKEKLSELSVQKKQQQSPYEELRKRVLLCLSEVLFRTFLVPPTTRPCHEIVFFDDIQAVKAQIVSSPRQAVLRALKDPHYYLKCDCCKLGSLDDIHPSLPDISIVYKLHLESGKLINMYDWLQSFLTIVNPCDGEEQRDVDPKLQARFTRAVAELQFLGFIKTSSRKTDHVTRLTWG